MWKQSLSSYVSPSQYKKNLRETQAQQQPLQQPKARWALWE